MIESDNLGEFGFIGGRKYGYLKNHVVIEAL